MSGGAPCPAAHSCGPITNWIEQMDPLPETFVDALGEISFKHGMIRIELVSLSGPEPRVTQRLVTNLPAFRQMLQAQHGMIEQLEKAGVIRTAQPGPAAAEAGPSSDRSSVVAAVRGLARIEPVPQRTGLAAAAASPEPPKSPNFSDEK